MPRVAAFFHVSRRSAWQGWLLLQARPGEWTVPEGVTHQQSPLQVATEIIRANIFAHCKDELPYAIDQRNIGWTELPSGDLRIDQELISPPKKSTEAIVRKRLPGIGKLARQLEGGERLGHVAEGRPGQREPRALRHHAARRVREQAQRGAGGGAVDRGDDRERARAHLSQP